MMPQEESQETPQDASDKEKDSSASGQTDALCVFSWLDELYEGHRSAYLRMLESAYTQCAEAQHAIDKALKAHDTTLLRQVVHQLRSLLKILQYEDLLQALEALARAAENKPAAPPEALWEKLLAALQSKRKSLLSAS